MQNTRRQEDLTGETLLEANNQEADEHDTKDLDPAKNNQLNNTSPTKDFLEVDKSFYVPSLEYVNLSQDDLPVTDTVQESSKDWKEEMVPGHAPRSPNQQRAFQEPTDSDSEREECDGLSDQSPTRDDKEDVMRVGNVLQIDVNKIRERKLMVPLPDCSGDEGDVLRVDPNSEEADQDIESIGTSGAKSVDVVHRDEKIQPEYEPFLEQSGVESDHIPAAPLVFEADKPSNGEEDKERPSTKLLVPDSPNAGGGSLEELVVSHNLDDKMDLLTAADAPPVIEANRKRARVKEKDISPWFESEDDEGMLSFISVFSSFVGPPTDVFPDISLEAKDDARYADVDSMAVYVIQRPFAMRYADLDAAAVFLPPQRFSQEYRHGLV